MNASLAQKAFVGVAVLLAALSVVVALSNLRAADESWVVQNFQGSRYGDGRHPGGPHCSGPRTELAVREFRRHLGAHWGSSFCCDDALDDLHTAAGRSGSPLVAHSPAVNQGPGRTQ